MYSLQQFQLFSTVKSSYWIHQCPPVWRINNYTYSNNSHRHNRGLLLSKLRCHHLNRWLLDQLLSHLNHHHKQHLNLPLLRDREVQVRHPHRFLFLCIISMDTRQILNHQLLAHQYQGSPQSKSMNQKWKFVVFIQIIIRKCKTNVSNCRKQH